MSKDFWDSRYSVEDFVYGTDPNKFFKEQIEKQNPGKALFIAEGEGRNAVYAATLGWNVEAVDFSTSAKDKALKLAEQNKVNINYTVCDLNEYNFQSDYFDLIVMIFVHLPFDLRKTVFHKSILSLKKDGRLIIEAFNKEQIKNNSGGPQSIDLLYSESDIIDLVNGMKTLLLESKVAELEEGKYHQGKADVLRYIGVKF